MRNSAARRFLARKRIVALRLVTKRSNDSILFGGFQNIFRVVSTANWLEHARREIAKHSTELSHATANGRRHEVISSSGSVAATVTDPAAYVVSARPVSGNYPDTPGAAAPVVRVCRCQLQRWPYPVTRYMPDFTLTHGRTPFQRLPIRLPIPAANRYWRCWRRVPISPMPLRAIPSQNRMR